jgi:hypothetical protein
MPTAAANSARHVRRKRSMDTNPYAPPQTPPEPPQRQYSRSPFASRAWYENPLHPATLAIVGTILGVLIVGLAVAILS